jgi:hypothetical protein
LLLAIGCGDPDRPDATTGVLPDLTFEAPRDLSVLAAVDGTRILFFSSLLVNQGEGALLINAERNSASWQVEQRASAPSNLEPRPIDASPTFGGTVEGRWQIVGLAEYALIPQKRGAADETRTVPAPLCLFDAILGRQGTRYGSEGCGSSESERLEMGLSAGAALELSWLMPGQSVDVSGLPDGRYRLEARADPRNVVAESNDDNNTGWVEFDFRAEGADGRPAVEIREMSRRD